MNFVYDGLLNVASKDTSEISPPGMHGDEDVDEDLRNCVMIETLHNGNRLRNRKHLIIDL